MWKGPSCHFFERDSPTRWFLLAYRLLHRPPLLTLSNAATLIHFDALHKLQGIIMPCTQGKQKLLYDLILHYCCLSLQLPCTIVVLHQSCFADLSLHQIFFALIVYNLWGFWDVTSEGVTCLNFDRPICHRWSHVTEEVSQMLRCDRKSVTS